jgi:hypothetical protein
LIKNELQLAAILREKLTPNFREIHTNINLASNRFYPDWEKWHGQPVPSAQPQIDLLLVDGSLWLLAAELKYFRKTSRGQVNHPFYAGIGEALALLRFGFMIVSLWHFFDEELERGQIRRLYRSCELLVDNLNLPINYQAFRVTKAGAELEFWRLYYEDTVQLKELPTAYGKSNPFNSNVDAQKIQDFLRTTLRIPQPR